MSSYPLQVKLSGSEKKSEEICYSLLLSIMNCIPITISTGSAIMGNSGSSGDGGVGCVSEGITNGK